MVLEKKIELLDKQKEVIEAKTEQVKTKAKLEIKLTHAYSMMVIKVGAVILAIVIVFLLLK
jgi:hypothetical protein